MYMYKSILYIYGKGSLCACVDVDFLSRSVVFEIHFIIFKPISRNIFFEVGENSFLAFKTINKCIGYTVMRVYILTYPRACTRTNALHTNAYSFPRALVLTSVCQSAGQSIHQFPASQFTNHQPE